jgi:broad specificity phosphatase PhoE
MFSYGSSLRYNFDRSKRTKSRQSRHHYNYFIQQRQSPSVLSLFISVAFTIFMIATSFSRIITTSDAFILLPKRASVSKTSSSVVKNNPPAFWFSKLHQSTGKIAEIVTLSDTTEAIKTMNTIPTIPPLSKMAKRVYWIRHGEVINPGAGQNKSVFYGSMDVPLSPFGQQEAIAAGKFLSQHEIIGPLSKIYSSNLTRAIYGAEQVRILQQQQQHNEGTPSPLEVIQVPGFMELNRGEWCGKTIHEIGQEQMDKFNNCDESVTPADGESYREFNSRVLQARNDIVLQELDFGQCAAVVSHLQVTRCIVADALQRPLNEVSKISIATASITCIDYEYGDVNSDGTNDAELNKNNIILPKQQNDSFPILQTRYRFTQKYGWCQLTM